jgi:hypothetical protein
MVVFCILPSSVVPFVMKNRRKFLLVMAAIAGLGFVFKDFVITQVSNAQAFITELMNTDDLWTQYDKKSILQPAAKDLYVFLDIDLGAEDFSFELSKMAYIHIWRQFIRNSTNLSIYVILNPVNFNVDRFEDLKTHLMRFAEELNLLKMPQINVSIERSDAFRKKYGIDSGQRLVVFTGPKAFESIKLDSIGDLYMTNALSFINYFADITNKYFDQISQDKTEIPYTDLQTNYLIRLTES